MNVSPQALLVIILISMGIVLVGEVKTGLHKLGCKIHIAHNCDAPKQP